VYLTFGVCVRHKVAHYAYNQTRSHITAVSLGFESLTGIYGHIFAFKENFVLVCRGASTLAVT
jgi:hypothetical protein